MIAQNFTYFVFAMVMAMLMAILVAPPAHGAEKPGMLKCKAGVCSVYKQAPVPHHRTGRA